MATLPDNTPARSGGKFSRFGPTVARVLMGLVFFVFGLSGFINFMPPPPPNVPEAAMAFGAAMMKTGYLFQLIKGTEVLVGALLLLNRFVPLALALIAPVVVNILAFHVFLERGDYAIPVVVLALELYLAWSYRSAYRPMLRMRTTTG
jgi:uncharacterized membrane protein YphA (DoxX/SURF4 family)